MDKAQDPKEQGRGAPCPSRWRRHSEPQRRRVTAYDLHATLRHLADWPTMPPPAEEATSLFVDLPDERTCEAAKVPIEFCLESGSACFEGT